MHLRPGRNFQFVFPLPHVNKLLCLLIMASHGQGESVCLPPPPPFLLPSPHHNLSPPSRIWLESLSSRTCLGFNKSLYQEQVGGGGGDVCTCKSFANMKSSKRTPEYVLLDRFCPFPIWIGKYAAWQNGLLSPKGAIWPTRPGACDKCLHFWLSTRTCRKNRLFIWATCIKKSTLISRNKLLPQY